MEIRPTYKTKLSIDYETANGYGHMEIPTSLMLWKLRKFHRAFKNARIIKLEEMPL